MTQPNDVERAAEAPRVLGVAMGRIMDTPNWAMSFGALEVVLAAGHGNENHLWCCWISEQCIADNVDRCAAIVAIERELTAIRAAIPAPKEKP